MPLAPNPAPSPFYSSSGTLARLCDRRSCVTDTYGQCAGSAVAVGLGGVQVRSKSMRRSWSPPLDGRRGGVPVRIAVTTDPPLRPFPWKLLMGQVGCQEFVRSNKQWTRELRPARIQFSHKVAMVVTRVRFPACADADDHYLTRKSPGGLDGARANCFFVYLCIELNQNDQWAPT